MSTQWNNQLPLAPLGAGDLIDRAVRLYRRYFFTLIRIAAPPVIVAAAGSILFSFGARQLAATGSASSLLLFLFLLFVGLILWGGGNIFSLVVMGGATRNLVSHLLSGEPVSARATYKAIKSRFWGLLVASLVMSIWLGGMIFIAFVAWYAVIAVVVLGAVMLGQVAPFWLAAAIGVIGSLAASIVCVWILFFLVGLIAYVPQAMLVEGKGVF